MHTNTTNNDFVDTCTSERNRIMNDRAYSRLVPSQPLQPYLSVAPVQTKYTILPLVNHRTPASVPMIQRPTYNISDTFNPGTGAGPWSGFSTEINTESILRNQTYALQKCSQAVYVPKSSSDLYNIRRPSSSQQTSQPFPNLFTEYVTPQKGRPALNKGPALFNNSTRTALKEEDSDC